MTSSMHSLANAFRIGDIVKLDDQSYEVKFQDEAILYIKSVSDETLVLTLNPDEVVEFIKCGRLCAIARKKIPFNTSFLSPKERDEAEAIEHVCQLMNEYRNPTTDTTYHAVRNQTIPTYGKLVDKSKSTYARWFKKWREADKGAVILATSKRNRGHRNQLPYQEIELISEITKLSTRRNANISIRKIYEMYINQTDYVNPKTGRLISYETFRSHCNRVDPFDKKCNRYNRTGMKTKTKYALERVEADATPVYGKFQLPNGDITHKIFLYTVIDVHTRAVLSFYIDYESEGECSHSAIHSLILAASKKEDHERWPMCGIYSTLAHDSGSSYISDISKRIFKCLGSIVVQTPTLQPWRKAFVERLFKTIQDQLLTNQSCTIFRASKGSSFDATWNKRSTSLTPIKIETFEKIVEDYILDEYHHSPHSGMDSKSPYLAWKEQIDSGICVPDILDLEHANLVLGIKKSRTPSSQGVITVDYQQFTHPDYKRLLIQARKHTNNHRKSIIQQTDPRFEKVDILFNPLDSGSILVENPVTGEAMTLDNTRGEEAKGVPYKHFKRANKDNAQRSLDLKSQLLESHYGQGFINNSKNRSGNIVSASQPTNPHTSVSDILNQR